MIIQTFSAGKHLTVQGDSFPVFSNAGTKVSVLYFLVTVTYKAKF